MLRLYPRLLACLGNYMFCIFWPTFGCWHPNAGRNIQHICFKSVQIVWFVLIRKQSTLVDICGWEPLDKGHDSAHFLQFVFFSKVNISKSHQSFTPILFWQKDPFFKTSKKDKLLFLPNYYQYGIHLPSF